MEEPSVISEIHKLIDDKISTGVVVNVDWVAAEILSAKKDINGEDAPFYRVCTFREVVRVAKRAIGKYEAADKTPEQIVLPGFKHLCKAYPMTRNGVVVLVPVTMCTDQELISRADQFEEMAKGCRAHAREIRSYIMHRQKGEVA